MEFRVMSRTSLSLRLREHLGMETSEDLTQAFEDAKKDMLAAAQDRFEARLSIVASQLREEMHRGNSELRIAMTDGFSKIRQEMADLRVDVLRWSFLFWIGQLAATVSVLAYMLRSIGR
jgi:hypothetical protein